MGEGEKEERERGRQPETERDESIDEQIRKWKDT